MAKFGFSLRRKKQVSSDQAEDSPVKLAKPPGRLKRSLKRIPSLKEIDSIGLDDLIKEIKRRLTPKSESVRTLGFELGEVSTPVLGVPHAEVDVTYEVNSPFQYVNVRFDGEELIYHVVEPMLSDGELKYLKIIKHAFEKMTHSEIVIIGAKNREEYLKDRFSMIINIYLMKLDYFQKGKMFYHLLKKYIGYGKIDVLMKDPFIEDITCNGSNSPVYVNHRIYGSIRTDITFEEVELNNFVMKISQGAGRHISVLQPILDATLADGSRVNLTLGREVTRKGSTFTIRRFRTNPVSPVDLIKYGTFDSKQLAYLWIILEYKRSVLAAGGTASGKTTTLNALCAFIRPEYKIVSIEDTAELNLIHPNWTQSITRSGFGGEAALAKSGGNGSGKGGAAGDIELYDLLSFSDAMKDMAASLGSNLITKYTVLVIQAAYTGGAVADLILRTSEDMRAVIGIEREKEGNLKQYVVIFYLAQGIIVMLAYILSTKLLPLIQGAGMELLFGNAGVAEINFERGFFHMIMLNALFGGIIIGQITEGEMKHGLKHSAILIVACYIACTTLILPSPAASEMRIELVSGGGQEGFGGIPLSDPIIFNVTDLKGNPAPDVYVKVSISPDGSVNPNIVETEADGLVKVTVVPGSDEGVYAVEAKAGDAVARASVRVLSGD